MNCKRQRRDIKKTNKEQIQEDECNATLDLSYSACTLHQFASMKEYKKC